MNITREFIEAKMGKECPAIFVTGIDTNIGKTAVSAVLTKELGYDYWKPIQCGELDALDSDVVRSIQVAETKIHAEQVLLDLPASPHLAAKREGREMFLTDFKLPITKNGLVIEGAGGIIVPMNENGFTVFDVIQEFADGVVLVVKHYLGSLNHSLLSIEKLKSGRVPLIGVVFNGDVDEESESIIRKMHPDIPFYARMAESNNFKQEKIEVLD